jgi:serine protease Do
VRFLFAVFLMCAFASNAWSDIDYRLFSTLILTVLKVEAHNGDGSVSIGSGVMIAEGSVVTNCHVTRNAKRINLVKGGARFAVEAQSADPSHDVCILFAPGATTIPVASLSRRIPRVGDPVIAVGYIGGLGPRVAGGEVKAVYELDGGRVVQTSAAFASGASGGGLFDQNGDLVGVIAFKYPGGQAYHFSLPLDWVRQTLRGGHPREVAPLAGGFAFWQQPAEKQPYFLKAAALEAEGEWQKLLALAKEWTSVEAANADGWLVLGHAYARDKKDDDAIASYRRSVTLNVNAPDVWYALGAAYGRLREHREVAHVYKVLQGMDDSLADALAKNFLWQCAKNAAIASC